MDKLKMHSPDLIEANIARLAELFPNCVTEAADGKGGLKKCHRLRPAAAGTGIQHRRGAAGALPAQLAGQARGAADGQRTDCQDAAPLPGRERGFR
jgi:hypothetical protein